MEIARGARMHARLVVTHVYVCLLNLLFENFERKLAIRGSKKYN